MRKIFISAGHSNQIGKDRGAQGNGFIEGELTVELRDLIVHELKKQGVNPIVDQNHSVLAESLNFFKNLTTNSCIVLDIHWNAGPSTATGTETLVPVKPSEFETKLAKNLSACISKTLNIKLRGPEGVKTEADSHHGRLGWMRLTGENVLIETCFISNKSDMDKYQANKYILARNIAIELTNAAQDFNSTIITKQKLEHVVVEGDTLFSISKKYNIPMSILKKQNNMTSVNIKIGQKLKL
jgi:N-acetylmuramoyl-L-alanine amidase